MPEETTVIMYSEVYGAEEYSYETVAEALDGLRRLGESTLKAFATDGIVRDFRILPTTEWQKIRET